MKKIVSICAVCLVLMSLLIGCEKSDAKRIIGTWEYRFTDTHAAYYQKYIFKKNGEGSFEQIHAPGPMQGAFTYKVDENGTLTLMYPEGWQLEEQYVFNDDGTVLTLTYNHKTYDLMKAK